MRFLISVFVPVYKPDILLLKKTLTSICESIDGIDNIEICVVNDCISDKSVRLIVNEFSSRVRLFENERTLGIGGNWNRCIELSKGEWIHILHQDDLVSPGFYRSLIDLQMHEEVDVFATRFFVIDTNGHIISVSRLEESTAGFLKDAARKIISTNTIQCPSILVKRSVYSQIGKFNDNLKYVLDWEMWFRISLNYKIWYDPNPLVSFRRHSASETSRLKVTGESARDVVKGVSAIIQYAPLYEREARKYGVKHILSTAEEFLRVRRWEEGMVQLLYAPNCLFGILFKWSYIRCWVLLLKIVLKNNFQRLVDYARYKYGK